MTYSEYTDSQAPAVRLLQRLGWQPLHKEAVHSAREGRSSQPVLHGILRQWLQRRTYTHAGQALPYSSSSIERAITTLLNVPDQGLVATNQAVYELLTLGKSVEEFHQGEAIYPSLHYIDWEQPANNVYHLAEEFTLEGPHLRRRCDIVLFVNGIPLAVLECKRRDKNRSIDEAIAQQRTYQTEAHGIPRLYHYAQLLLAVQPNQVRYAVVNSPAAYWLLWKEDLEQAVSQALVTPHAVVQVEDRLPTEQDRCLYALCSIPRLLTLTYKFMVFDGPIKKVARYQQYFAVQSTLARVKKLDSRGKRQGGVIWHTQGSGKSLTMVMLSKSLALDPDIPNARILVVTDRISLDDQIFQTFSHCGKEVKKASSGTNLVELIQDGGQSVITAIIDKFAGAGRAGEQAGSEHFFVLIDESHRSQYGSAHAALRKVLPRACYIGFTGTPLMRKEKSTSSKFGGFIHKYTINQAVEDGAVLPLLYEGRAIKLNVDNVQLDKGYERLTAPLSEEAKNDLKRKFATINRIFQTDSIIEEIAYDISEHAEVWKGTGYKAQLAVPRIETAVKYQRYFETQTNPELRLNTRVIFTPPDSRQATDEGWQDASQEVRTYWARLMEQYKDQATYEKWVLDKFKDPGNEVQMIIVVTKLLTGFDAPRNTYLYLAKPLKEHNLLQAIARVNRVFEGKRNGFIIDYVGLLGNLDDALTSYSALEEFEEDDLQNTVIDIQNQVRQVPILLANVWEVLNGHNRADMEALERALEHKDKRDIFAQRLAAYARCLSIARSVDSFDQTYSEQQIKHFREELTFLVKLRASVSLRYGDRISLAEYEPAVRKLLDKYVGAEEVMQLSKDINIFDESILKSVVADTGKTPASKADMIAHKMKRVIAEKMEEDEVYYQKFSELIKEAIDSFLQSRIDEQEYLSQMLSLHQNFKDGVGDDVPDAIADQKTVKAYYRLFADKHPRADKALLAEMSVGIDQLLSKSAIVDWQHNHDVENRMRNELEDYLMGQEQAVLGHSLTLEELDFFLDKCLIIAKAHYVY